jgi:tetratricopeptide (TPR) repeat protein
MNASTPVLQGLIIAVSLGVSATAHSATVTAIKPSPAAVTASSDSPQANEHRAGIQALLSGKLLDAKTRFEASLKIDAAYAPAWVGLAAVAQAQGSMALAEKHLKEAQRVAPKAPEVPLAWGRLHLSRNDTGKAETAFRQAHELAPAQIPPLLELGNLYLRLNNRAPDALSAFQKAVSIDGKNALAQYGRGVSAASVGQREEAFAALQLAAELAPQDPAPHRAMGRLHLEAGAVDKALAAFDAGLARQPRFVPLMVDRGDALGRAGRWDDAVRQLEAAAALAPDAAEVQVKLGDAHQGAARWNEAEKFYLQAIRLNARAPIAYNNLAWMTVERKGDARKAVEWAGEAVKLSPGSSPFHDTLGWAQRAAGDLPAAARSHQRAISLEPNVASYHYHLGLVLVAMQKPAEAQAALKRALDLDPKLPQADEVRRLLRSP